MHADSVALEDPTLLCGPRLPQPHHSIRTRAGKQTAVGGQRYATDPARVAT